MAKNTIIGHMQKAFNTEESEELATTRKNRAVRNDEEA